MGCFSGKNTQDENASRPLRLDGAPTGAIGECQTDESPAQVRAREKREETERLDRRAREWAEGYIKQAYKANSPCDKSFTFDGSAKVVLANEGDREYARRIIENWEDAEDRISSVCDLLSRYHDLTGAQRAKLDVYSSYYFCAKLLDPVGNSTFCEVLRLQLEQLSRGLRSTRCIRLAELDLGDLGVVRWCQEPAPTGESDFDPFWGRSFSFLQDERLHSEFGTNFVEVPWEGRHGTNRYGIAADIHLSYYLLENEVICDHTPVVTIIHEATHKFLGTVDHFYFDDLNDLRGLSNNDREFQKRITNADSFGWFVFLVGGGLHNLPDKFVGYAPPDLQ